MNKENLLENVWTAIKESLSSDKEVKKEAAKEEKTELAEEVKEEKEVVEAKPEEEAYVKMSAFEGFKNEVLSMIKALAEAETKKAQEIPQELSKVEESEEIEKEDASLSAIEEIVHSPENKAERSEVLAPEKPYYLMTTLERIQHNLNR